MRVTSISKQFLQRKLIIQLEDGVNRRGGVRIRKRTYSKIKQSSTPESLYTAGKALAGLMAKPLNKISVLEKSRLVQA